MGFFIPRKGHYILHDVWAVDIAKMFCPPDFMDYNEWKIIHIDFWLNAGAVQLDKTVIGIPIGAVVSLVSLHISTHKDEAYLRFFKKYNGKHNNLHDLAFYLTNEQLDDFYIPGKLLTKNEAEALVLERKK